MSSQHLLPGNPPFTVILRDLMSLTKDSGFCCERAIFIVVAVPEYFCWCVSEEAGLFNLIEIKQ